MGKTGWRESQAQEGAEIAANFAVKSCLVGEAYTDH